MPWKRKSSRSFKNPYHEALAQAKLYLILDTEVQNYDLLFETAKQALLSGVDIVQLRDKKGSVKDILKFSKRLLEFLKRKSLAIPFITNDRVDLALACGAAGVHLGQEDLPISFVRKLMGPQAIIGASCQNFEQAKRAEREGADYIGFGSVFKTKTKPHRLPMDLKLLEEITRKIKIPVFAIGGIDQYNILTLRRKGIKRIAVCRAVCEAGDVRQATRGFIRLLEQ